MRLSIKSLVYFQTAAELGSIARAAEKLNVAASAISNAIDAVEAEFALTLVQRFPAKGITPTAEGRAMMRKVRHLIDEYQSLLLEGAELRTALSGNLRIGYYAPVAPGFLPQIVSPLLASRGNLRLDFVECDNESAQAGLLSGSFDAILFVAENVKPGIAWETLAVAPPYVLVQERHPLARRETLSLTELQGENLVLLELPFSNAYYRRLLEDQGVAVSIAATASSTEMVRSLVGQGLGCALLNMRPATETTYGGHGVCAVPLEPALKPLTLALGHRGDKPRRLLAALLDSCRDYFAARDKDWLVLPPSKA